MSRIGEMPDAEEIANGGFLIYSDDGKYANKISVEDFARAMSILMNNDGDGGIGDTGSGLQGWKEFSDGHNTYLLTEYDMEKGGTLANSDPFGGGRDIWYGNFQFDSWDSPAPIPNLEGVLSIQKDGEYAPFILFATLHKIGESLDDYTKVEEGLYKIETDKLDKYEMYLYFGNYTSRNPDENSITYSLHEDNSIHLAYKEQGITFTVHRYKLNDIYSSRDNAEDALGEMFPVITGNQVMCVGYERIGYIIDNLYKYTSKDSYDDDDTYTYISFTPSETSINGLQFSSDTSYYDIFKNSNIDCAPVNENDSQNRSDLIGALFEENVGIMIRKYSTVFSSKGLFIGIPFNRSQQSTTSPSLDLDSALAAYTGDKIAIKYPPTSGDVLYTPESYAERVAYRVSRDSNIVRRFFIGPYNIMNEDNDAVLYLGNGLRFDPDGNVIEIDETYLQTPLTGGPGTSVNQSTGAITFESAVTDVQLDGTSVMDGTVAKLETPDNLKQIQLVNGDHTSVETVSEDSERIVQKVNLVDVQNNIVTSNSTYSYNGNPLADRICEIDIPANASGILMYSIIVNGGTVENTDGSSIAAMVNDYSYFPNSVSSYGNNPTYERKELVSPVLLDFADNTLIDGITAIQGMMIINNSVNYTKSYRLWVDIRASYPLEIKSELTFIQNIDI